MKIYNDVVSQLDAGGARYSQELSEIDLSDPDDVKVMANNHAGEVLVHLGSSNYLERYKIYVTHVQEWQQQFDKLESVDLRYDRQIIVNPDLQGPTKQPPLSAEAARKAMAAGVKPAALITRITTAPRPSPASDGENQLRHRVRSRLQQGRRQAQRPPRLRHHKATRPLRHRDLELRPEQKQSHGSGRRPRRAKTEAGAEIRSRGQGRGETKPGNCQGRNTIGMANQHEHLLTAIDVGSAKTCALVAEITDNGLRYRGHGVAESRGSRKGVIVDLDKAVSSIQKAVEQAEDVAGAPIEHALLGMAGAHARGINSHGGLSFGARAREIGRDELRAAVDKARAIPLPADREILHLLPQEFILDDQTGVQRSAGHDGGAARSARAHGHGRLQRHAERGHCGESRRRACGRYGVRAPGLRRRRVARRRARTGRVPGRPGRGIHQHHRFPGRRGGSHRSDSDWRRPLHQRSLGGTLHSGGRGGKDQAALRQCHRHPDSGRQ